MTLTKAIEAAKRFVIKTGKFGCYIHDANNGTDLTLQETIDLLNNKTLAALPDQPMTDDEIRNIGMSAVYTVEQRHGFSDSEMSTEYCDAVIRALKQRGVLFVKED